MKRPIPTLAGRHVNGPVTGTAGVVSGTSGGASAGMDTGGGGMIAATAGDGVQTGTGDVAVMPNAGSPAMPPGGFDAGTDPNRNAVTPGNLCDRLSTIQCAGEAACCASPGRDFNACKQSTQMACTSSAMVDAIAEQTSANFDAAQADMVFTQLETMSSQCDPGIAAYAASPQGLRSMFRGTNPPNGSCSPANMFNMAMAAGALASCTNGDAYACLPALTGTWICAPHAPLGGKCFTDVNCNQDLYCDNPKLAVSGSTCKARKVAGASCMTGNECLTLFCRNGSCQDSTAQAAYCLAGAS